MAVADIYKDYLVPVVIDVEASGFGRGSYPIEVGFVLPSGMTHCYLIRPEEDWTHWDDTAESLHHIRKEVLFQRGEKVHSVAEKLNSMLAHQTIYSDGWAQDTSWLALLFERAGIRQRFRVEHIASLFTPDQITIWESEKQKVMQELAAERHRASADARIVQMTYVKTRLKYLS